MAQSRSRRSPAKTPSPDYPKRTSSASSTATSISTSTTSTRCRQPSASRSHAAPRPPPWPTTRAFRTPRGGDFDTATSHKIMMNSRGFIGEYRRSYCGFSVSPIAQDEKGGMQRNYWFSNARTVKKLEDPEEIGREAARRTLQRLGARQVKTQKAPVVFSAGDGAVDHRQHLRRRQRRRHLSPRLLLQRTCWASGRRRQHHRHRRRHHGLSDENGDASAASALAPSTAKVCPRAAPCSSNAAS